MDLPVSGWYPDPYGTPDLLRWWDGSGWTQHTHPDVAAAGNGAGGTPSATTVLGAVDATALQGAAVADALQATTFQAPVGSTTVQPAAGQPSTGQPSPEWLRQTRPPTGPRTSPQPAVPGAPGIGLGGAYQQTATLGSTGGYQPTMVQPGYPQPGMGWGPGGGAAGLQGGGHGQNAWQQPGATGGYPGGPGNPYGYQQAQQQRRRRRNILIGVGVGVAVVVVVIVIAANSVGGASGNAPAASGSTTPTSSAAAAPSAAAKTAAPASASAAATASASPTAATDGSLITDTQSMLSYAQLPAPWQVTTACPLNSQVFPWTDGEDAPAGTVNTQSGPVNWTGEACSGVLPQSYGYTSTADLQNAAESVAETLQTSYYNALSPTGVNTENDSPLQVSGHDAWEVTFDVQYGNAQSMGSSITDEQAAVVVVDAGAGVSPAVFFASIPNTPTLNEGDVTTLVQSLQLNSSAATGAPTAAATEAGAPTAATPPAAVSTSQ